MDHSAKAYRIYSRIRGYRGLEEMLYSLRYFSGNGVARQRMNILQFYERYGERATKEAFGADRKLISKWRKRLKGKQGKLEALTPASTRPKRTRRSEIPVKIIDFIRTLREKHPKLGKEKIKPLLDEYCQEKEIGTISESTIGNVIKRHKLFFQRSGRVYHDPGSQFARKKKVDRRIKIKRSPRGVDFGHIISDTLERVTEGVKDYFYNAIDVKSRFALTLNYKRLTSKNMKDFYERFQSVYPAEIRVWQSDNGGENLGDFDAQLKRDEIVHLFSYPRCPKINAYVERYNRTVQEEFINNHLDSIHDKKLFNSELAEYLIFYNTKRVHKSLGKKAPLAYLIEQGVLSQMCLTYTTD
jgi:transposase InsO family protein